MAVGGADHLEEVVDVAAMEQDAKQLAEHDQGKGHRRRRSQHLALYPPLGRGVQRDVICRNGTSAIFGPMPISNTRNVSITPSAVIDVCSIV